MRLPRWIRDRLPVSREQHERLVRLVGALEDALRAERKAGADAYFENRQLVSRRDELICQLSDAERRAKAAEFTVAESVRRREEIERELAQTKAKFRSLFRIDIDDVPWSGGNGEVIGINYAISRRVLDFARVGPAEIAESAAREITQRVLRHLERDVVRG